MEGGRITVKGGGDRRERGNGYEGDGVRMLSDGGEKEIHGVWVGPAGLATSPRGLRKRSLTGVVLDRPDSYRDFGVPSLGEQPIDETGAQGSVAPGGCNTCNLKLRAGECEAKSQHVVYVVTNVGVKDDQLRGCDRLSAKVAAKAAFDEQQPEQAEQGNLPPG